MEKNKIRNSNLEILRIVSMILIIITKKFRDLRSGYII